MCCAWRCANVAYVCFPPERQWALDIESLFSGQETEVLWISSLLLIDGKNCATSLTSFWRETLPGISLWSLKDKLSWPLAKWEGATWVWHWNKSSSHDVISNITPFHNNDRICLSAAVSITSFILNCFSPGTAIWLLNLSFGEHSVDYLKLLIFILLGFKRINQS